MRVEIAMTADLLTFGMLAVIAAAFWPVFSALRG
jgi:hypothetical protein